MYKEKFPILTETKISEKIAGYLNHYSDISRGYKRIIFDSLSDSLATKRSILSTTREAPRTGGPAVPLAPIDEGGGESSGGPPPPPPARKPPDFKARRAARKAAKVPAPQRKPPPANKPPVAQFPRVRPAPQPQR